MIADRRVMMIGLDGATYDVLVPLAAAGVMPNLARLMQSGALAELNSTRPCITPTAWTTLQTGCDPHEHGIFDYRWYDGAFRQLRLNHARRIASPTLWDAVSQAGREVVSINMPMTYPPAPGVRGLIVGGLDSPSIEAAVAPYPEFARRLRASGASFDLQTIWKRKPRNLEELSHLVDATNADYRGRVVAAKIADELHDWQLLFVQFQSLDALQHRAWHLLGIDARSPAQAAWTSKVQETFCTLDACLGDLLELAEERGAAAVVVSDHGFGLFREKISIPALLHARGLLKRPDAGGLLRQHACLWRWKTRRWASRRQSGGGTASLARPPEMLMSADWRRSVALPLHGNLAGLVYLNSPARFGRGPLTTPRLVEQAAQDTIAAFREAKHPRTGEALFDEAYSLSQRHDVDCCERDWPDVAAIPAPGFHTRMKFDSCRDLLLPDDELTGTHRPAGVLMIAGDAASSGPATSHCAELRDVAPTVLHLLGIAGGSAMSGRVLHELLPEFGIVPPRTTREQIAVAVPAAHLAAADQAIVENRLRALGYLE